jgi:hypothetical protein
MSADENIGVAVDGLIVDAIAIGDVTCEDARFKVAIHKTGIHTHNNERLRRWIAMPRIQLEFIPLIGRGR